MLNHQRCLVPTIWKKAASLTVQPRPPALAPGNCQSTLGLPWAFCTNRILPWWPFAPGLFTEHVLKVYPLVTCVSDSLVDEQCSAVQTGPVSFIRHPLMDIWVLLLFRLFWRTLPRAVTWKLCVDIAFPFPCVHAEEESYSNVESIFQSGRGVRPSHQLCLSLQLLHGPAEACCPAA